MIDYHVHVSSKLWLQTHIIQTLNTSFWSFHSYHKDHGTMVKTPVFYLQFTPAPCFFHANTQFLRRFGLCGFLCRLSKGPEVFLGGSWGIFATSFESKNGEYWFGKGTWLSQISFWMWREIAMRFMNVSESLIEIRSVWYPFCCAVQQQSLRKHEVLLAVIVIML